MVNSSGLSKPADWPTSDRPIGRRRSAGWRYVFNGPVIQAVMIALISSALFWLIWIYSSGLRDPRYLDGWLLAGGMGLQLCLHIAIKTGGMSSRAAPRWRKVHVFLGYLLIASFVSHSDMSLPDTAFEWALWTCFVLVTLSGVVGTYIAWSNKAKQEFDERFSIERIAARRVDLSSEVHETVARSDTAAAAMGLPVPPHDAWIRDLYSSRLKDFFEGPRNFASHLVGSQRPLRRLTEEIDSLARYVDKPNQDKLTVIKNQVIEKDRLDRASVRLALTRGWLFVHVPVTYALIVLTVLHVIVAYSFSSGAW